MDRPRIFVVVTVCLLSGATARAAVEAEAVSVSLTVRERCHLSVGHRPPDVPRGKGKGLDRLMEIEAGSNLPGGSMVVLEGVPPEETGPGYFLLPDGTAEDMVPVRSGPLWVFEEDETNASIRLGLRRGSPRDPPCRLTLTFLNGR